MLMTERGGAQTKPRRQLQRCLVPIHHLFPVTLTVGSLSIPFLQIMSASSGLKVNCDSLCFTSRFIYLLL